MRKLIALLYILIQLQSIIAYGQLTESALFFNKEGSHINIPSSPSLSPAKEITIECWIKPNQPNWTNKFQTILSKREYTPLANFTDLQNWEIFDATNINGQSSILGFVGAVFDGRYVYLSPWWRGSDKPQSGEVVRYDTHGTYEDANSWATYNAENEDGSYTMRGLEGAVFDGRYVYFVPLHTEGVYSGRFLRYDTKKDFFDTGSWDVYSIDNAASTNQATVDFHDAKGFVGAVFDGQYIYFPPNPFEPHYQVVRYNTKGDFFNKASWEVYNFSNKYGFDVLNGCFGAIFDGRYVYFVPQDGYGNILRFDTSNSFSDDNAWQIYNVLNVLPPDATPYFAGAVFDGRYIYFSPVYGGSMLRYDTKGDFLGKENWQTISIINLDGNYSIDGGIGPVFDGRNIYFPPMFNWEGRSGKFIVYDTYKEFSDLSSWNYLDWKTQDEQLAGFEGGVFDGQHVYFSPMNFDSPHGKILRYNVAANNGLSYALVYNQSSSSFGSVLQRLTFQVSTEQGLRSISLLEEVNLADGALHHIAATYNGTTLSIYLDGRLNNQMVYASPADILVNQADFKIGAESDRSSEFDGSINKISIWNTAYTSDVIQQHFTCNNFSGSTPGLMAYWPLNEGTGEIVNDLSSNNNKGQLINEPVWVQVDFPHKVYAGNDEQVCAYDQPFILQDFYPAGGVWSGNGVDSSGMFTPSSELANTIQTLIYTYKDTSGCTYSSVKKITVLSNDMMPAISATYDSFLCTGESAILTVEGEYDKYLWSTGDTTKSIQVSQTGEYTVRVVQGNHCLSLPSVPAAIETLAQMPEPVINLTDLTSLNAVIPTGNVYYEWKRGNDTLPFHTQTIKITQPGFYSVRVKNSNNCYSEFSEPFYYTPPSSDQILEKNINITPNPSNGIFKVTVSDFNVNIHISVTDLTGKLLYKTPLSVKEGLTTAEIDLTHLPKSVYLMNFVSGYGVLHKKIIIQ